MIGTFMDNYLRLSTAENRVYNREIEKIEPKEREVVMQLTNSWIERGRVKGRQEGLRKGLEKGRQKGLQEGQREVVLRLLRRKFGEIPTKFAAQVELLSSTDLGHLADVLLEISTMAEARQWLAERENR